jgi:hypothetical protein
MHGKTFFHVSVAERWAKKRLFAHPPQKDGRGNVSPPICTRKMHEKTLFRPSAPERCTKKRFSVHPWQKDARRKAWGCGFCEMGGFRKPKRMAKPLQHWSTPSTDGQPNGCLNRKTFCLSCESHLKTKSFGHPSFSILALWRLTVLLVASGGSWWTSTSEGAVQELWRVYSTNVLGARNFSVSASAMDTNGNTVVTGTYSTAPNQNLFIAAYDPTGAKLWEFTGRPTFRVYVDGLVIRPDGAVIVSYAENDGQFHTRASLVCVKGGEFDWERIEPNVNYGEGYRKLKVNENGEVFVYGFDWLEQPPSLNFPASVAKFDIAGHALWLTRPPFISIGTASSPMPFDLSSAGHPIIAGVAHDNFPSVVACLNEVTGKVRWKRRPRGVFSNSAAVKAGPKSICVSGDDGYVVYANNGRRLAVRRDFRFFSDRITNTRDGGFMLLSPHSGERKTVLSPAGRVRWTNTLEPYPTLGFFEDTVDGYVVVGGTGSSVIFRRLDKNGQPVTSELFGEYPSASWYQRGTTALAATDGTWRVVVNRNGYDFIIAAYGEAPPQ